MRKVEDVNLPEAEQFPFKVPYPLEPLVDDHVLAVHERWQDPDIIFREHNQMPEVRTISLPNDRRLRAAVLYPFPWHRDDENEALGLILPHAQAWKPSMFIRAEVTRQIVAPNSPMVVFPNNSLINRSYDLTKEELDKVAAGNLLPVAELQVRALEELRLGGANSTHRLLIRCIDGCGDCSDRVGQA